MRSHDPQAIFDQKHAAGYDQRWAKLAPLRDALHLFIETVLSELRADARVLCVGVGTGAELIHLAQRFPRWQFTAVEPSTAMLDVCRRKAEEHGISDRCVFHAGYLDSLPPSEPFDAATSLLVSQFVLDRQARVDFFQTIASRLRAGAFLINSDLTADTNSAEYQSLLELWLRVMKSADFTPEDLERLRTAYSRDVAVLPESEVCAILMSGGFGAPIQFLQTGLIHAWYARRA